MMKTLIRDDGPEEESWRFVCFNCRESEKILVHMGSENPDDDKMFCGQCLAKALNLLEVNELKMLKKR